MAPPGNRTGHYTSHHKGIYMTRRITSQVQSVVGGSGIQSGTQSLHGFYTRPHTYITTQTVDLAAAFKPKRAG